jgi:hypothetical protein
MHIAEGMLSGWQIALTSALAAGPVCLRALARRSASLVPGWCRDALAMGVVVALLCAPTAAGAFEAAMAGAVGEPAPVEEGAGSLALIAGMFAAGVAVGCA